VDRHKQQPFGAPLLAAGALSRGENATDHHLGGEWLAAPAGESLGSAIAPVALTQGARAAFFSASTGPMRRNFFGQLLARAALIFRSNSGQSSTFNCWLR
jgi:hypothetical protein